MFTVMFALGRLPGWIAQWKEMSEENQPMEDQDKFILAQRKRLFRYQ